MATVTSLTFLPSPLRASLGMILAAIIFVDVSYRFFRKNFSTGETATIKSVVYLMTYWSVLSITLDILIFIIILPVIANGNLNLAFFNQQPSIYWLQFPMFFVFGFASQAIYNRVISIKTANIDHI